MIKMTMRAMFEWQCLQLFPISKGAKHVKYLSMPCSNLHCLRKQINAMYKPFWAVYGT